VSRRGRRKGARGKTPLRAALRSNSQLLPQVADGIAALRKEHRALLEEGLKPDLADSLDLDAGLQAAHPQENRWDYLLGHGPSEEVVALESHTATDGEVAVLIAKREAARRQLGAHLRDGAGPSAWIWVTEGRVGFAPTEKARRRLDQAGITFAGRRVLAKHLPKPKSKP
jgi:hypothetical protein